MSYHPTEDWLKWLDTLAEDDYVIIDHFLKPELNTKIRSCFMESLPAFSKAGIGTMGDHMVRHDIRGDHTYWLDDARDTELADFWSLIEETTKIFNRYCFLSLSGYEFHFANYPPGAKYEKHIDQFEQRGNRMITMIIYLNKDWKKEDGGELEVFPSKGEPIIIDPLEARCVLFKSAVLPHRVLESHKDRYSLTGWLLYQPAVLGQLFG